MSEFENRYIDLDKQMTKEIMSEFINVPIDVICPHCHGEGKYVFPNETIKCSDCNGEGHYLLIQSYREPLDLSELLEEKVTA